MVKIGFGIFCTNSDGSLSTNHTFRINNLSFDRVFTALKSNITDMFELLELCSNLEIKVFRLGSNFIPYASHRAFKEEWFKRIEPIIVDAGEQIKRKFKIRITMHPGQFVILNSKNPEVIDNSLRELEYHFWVLDKLGIEEDGIVIIHVGGGYGDKKASAERFMRNVEKNNWLKRRLAIENDEKIFNAQEVLEIAKHLKIPFVFDFFHHLLNPSEVDMKEVFRTWQGKGVPKVHLSSEGHGKFGTHGDYIEINDFIKLRDLLNESKISEVHVMIEAKKKEKAIIDLRNKMPH